MSFKRPQTLIYPSASLSLAAGRWPATKPIENPKTYSHELADVAEDNLGMYEYFLVHGAGVQVVRPTLLFALLEGVGVLKRIAIRQTVEVLYIMSPGEKAFFLRER
jgi:hypothetical protein